MTKQLAGQVAIVTGASSGNGRAIATMFADQGAAVVCVDLRAEPRAEGYETDSPQLPTDELIRSKGGKSSFITTDVSDAAAMENVVSETVASYGQLNVIVNNAGIYTGLASVTEESEEVFDRHVAVHLKGTWAGSRAAIKQFLRQGSDGRVISISSIGGLTALSQEPGYSASKAAVVNLTRQMALDYGRQGITFNAICPGYIATAMTRSMLEDPRIGKSIEDATPSPRLGRPEDIAHAALYLASPQAAFVNGTALVVDGGWMAGEYFRTE